MNDAGDDTLDLSYLDAMDELDDILAQLESSAVDVDVLAERVARGAVLVRHCRQRLQRVQVEVEAVVDGLEPDPNNSNPNDSGPNGGGTRDDGTARQGTAAAQQKVTAPSTGNERR